MTADFNFYTQCPLPVVTAAQAGDGAAFPLAGPHAVAADHAAALAATSARLAQLWAQAGARPGAAVLVCMPDGTYSAAVALAAWRAGLVLLQAEAAITPDGLAHALQCWPSAVLVCDVAVFGWASKAAFLAGVPAVYTVGAQGEGTLLDRARHHSAAHTPVALPADAVALQRVAADGSDVPGGRVAHGDAAALVAHGRQHWVAADVACLPAA